MPSVFTEPIFGWINTRYHQHCMLCFYTFYDQRQYSIPIYRVGMLRNKCIKCVYWLIMVNVCFRMIFMAFSTMTNFLTKWLSTISLCQCKRSGRIPHLLDASELFTTGERGSNSQACLRFESQLRNNADNKRTGLWGRLSRPPGAKLLFTLHFSCTSWFRSRTWINTRVRTHTYT